MRIPATMMGLLLAWTAGCGRAPKGEAKTETMKPAVAVSAARVAPVEWPWTYEVTGTVRARTSAVISAKVMGYVREVTVRPGDRVREGAARR